MDTYQYLVLMALCLLVTLPLELVLGARVYAQPRRLLKALLPVVLLYAVWDIVGIYRGHWWYSAQYTTGVLLPLRMPLEELVFFIVIPVCGLLTYGAVGTVMTMVRDPRGLRGIRDHIGPGHRRHAPAPERGDGA